MEINTIGPDWNASDFMNFCCNVTACRACVCVEFVTLLLVKQTRLGFLSVFDVLDEPCMCCWFLMVFLLQIWDLHIVIFKLSIVLWHRLLIGSSGRGDFFCTPPSLHWWETSEGTETKMLRKRWKTHSCYCKFFFSEVISTFL